MTEDLTIADTIGQAAITTTTDGVTIDLNGHTITAGNVSSPSTSQVAAILVQVAVANIVIKNGFIELGYPVLAPTNVVAGILVNATETDKILIMNIASNGNSSSSHFAGEPIVWDRYHKWRWYRHL